MESRSILGGATRVEIFKFGKHLNVRVGIKLLDLNQRRVADGI